MNLCWQDIQGLHLISTMKRAMYAEMEWVNQCRHIGMIPIWHEDIDGGHTSQKDLLAFWSIPENLHWWTQCCCCSVYATIITRATAQSQVKCIISGSPAVRSLEGGSSREGDSLLRPFYVRTYARTKVGNFRKRRSLESGMRRIHIQGASLICLPLIFYVAPQLSCQTDPLPP